MKNLFNPAVLALALIIGSGMLLTSAVKHREDSKVVWWNPIEDLANWAYQKLDGFFMSMSSSQPSGSTCCGGGGGDAFGSTTPNNTN